MHPSARKAQLVRLFSPLSLILAALACSLMLATQVGANDRGNGNDHDRDSGRHHYGVPHHEKDHDYDDQSCRPGVAYPSTAKGRGNQESIPEFPGPVTTVCVGKHPEDVGIAPSLNLAVVANRDSRSLSLINVQTARVTGTVRLPVRPTRVAVDGTLAAVVSPRSPYIYLIDLVDPRHSVTPLFLGKEASDVALDATSGLAMALVGHRRSLAVVDFRRPGSPTVAMLRLPEPANALAYSRDIGGWALATSEKSGGLLFIVDVLSNPSGPLLRQTKALSRPSSHGHGGDFSPAGIDVTSGDQVQALIVDKDGGLLAYDLARDLFAQPYSVARGPIRGVAGDQARNLAVVPGQNDDAFIVDLAGQSTLYRVPVGVKPVAAAVNVLATGATAGVAAVVNRNQNSVSLFNVGLAEPPLRIRSLAPNAIEAGHPNPLAVEIRGTGFTPAAVVRFDGTVVSSVYNNTTSLAMTIPASLLATSRTALVTVKVGSRTSNAAVFTIYPPQNPLPVIVPPLRPSNVVAGSVPAGTFQAVEVDGTGFLPNSEVRFDGQVVQFGYFSSTQLSMRVPAELLVVPRTVTVTVTNPAPGGGMTTIPFDIVPDIDPAGVVSELVYVGAPTYGVAVDERLGMAIVTHYGDVYGNIGNTVSRLENLAGALPSDPPRILGGPIRVGQAPALPAVNSLTGVAVIPNAGDGSVSLVNLTDGSVRTLDVGLYVPDAVAIDHNLGIAAITSLGDSGGGEIPGSITLFDLSLGTVIGSPFVVDYPGNVAIHPTSHLAVTTDQFDSPGEAILLSLTNPAVPEELARIPVGDGPTRVAIYATRNLALIANTWSGDVSVIDLTARQETARIPVGNEPVGIAIDEARGIAVAVTRIDAKLIVIDLKTPTPTVVSSLATNLPFIPTEIALVPGAPGGLRLLTSDFGSGFIGVVHIDDSVLPLP